MTNGWYYAEGNRHRQGPLPPENIVELYRSGRIGLDTLVWRDGWAQWQPLSEAAAELGIAMPARDADTPPPLPPPPAQPTATAPSTTAPPPRKGLSGCAIAAIVAAVAGVFLMILLGILAAIALPAYQQYVLRSKTAGAVELMRAHEDAIAGFHAREGRCPVNGDEGFGAPESYADKPLGALRIGRFDDGHCGMEGQVEAAGEAEIDGKAIWLDYDESTGNWHCSSEIDDRYLPSQCRG